MKKISLMLVTVLFGGSMAMAQVCPGAPGSVCLVPSPQATMTLQQQQVGTATTVCPQMGQTVTTIQPIARVVQQPAYGSCAAPVGIIQTTGTTSSTMGIAPVCPTSNVSPETACVLNELAALRGETRAIRGQIYATSLEMRGQELIHRLSLLQREELAFRQQIAANPNLPNAQLFATSLQNQANALNQDIAAFNTEVNMVPMNMRPYVAQQLGTFQTVYWQPAMQRFAAYRTQFPQSATQYQPAFAANPWLPGWHAGYQTTITAVAVTPTQVAVAAPSGWWTDTRVLGSTETYQTGTMMQGQIQVLGSTETLPGGGTVIPGGTSIMLADGSVVCVPAGTMLYIPPSSMQLGTAPTTPVMTMPVTPAPMPAPVMPTPAPTTPATTPPTTGAVTPGQW